MESPIWSQEMLDITSHKYCVVGEAHRFNDDYTNPKSTKYCLDCKIFSLRFNTGSTEIEKLKDKFFDHWKTTHYYR